MKRNGTRTLLMGGHACVFCGAEEFSRVIDLLVLADSDSLDRVRSALDELHAEIIAIPPFDPTYLAKGHALHFRCKAPGVENLRVDIMATMRGVAGFEELWARRTTLFVKEAQMASSVPSAPMADAAAPRRGRAAFPASSLDVQVVQVDLLSLEDLVQAKKTQRDKDWPMIRRFLERSYFDRPPSPGPGLVAFWLRELRTPELLCAVAEDYPEAAASLAQSRPAVTAAMQGGIKNVDACLATEEAEEPERDRIYWVPLKRELEALRRAKHSRSNTP